MGSKSNMLVPTLILGILAVVLVLIGLAPYVEPEYHVLLGFTAGILVDLVGSGTLGLWAMSFTIVAFLAGRLRGLTDADSKLVMIIDILVQLDTGNVMPYFFIIDFDGAFRWRFQNIHKK